MPRSHDGEDWLLMLISVLDLMLLPSPRKILNLFAGWESPEKFRYCLKSFDRSRYVETGDKTRGRKATNLGRLAAWGNTEPVARWQRPWDGQWRLVLFDLPARDVSLRQRLARWLHGHRLGYLQNSVWITPDPIDERDLPLRRLSLSAEAFSVLTSRPAAPHSDASLVAGAWDFAGINEAYRSWLTCAERGADLAELGDSPPSAFRGWLKAEREAWLASSSIDPFLPERLLPADYLGRQAWERRQSLFRDLAQRVVEP